MYTKKKYKTKNMAEDEEWAIRTEKELSQKRKAMEEKEQRELIKKTKNIIETAHQSGATSWDVSKLDPYTVAILHIVTKSFDAAKKAILEMGNLDIYRMYLVSKMVNIPGLKEFFKSRHIWRDVYVKHFGIEDFQNFFDIITNRLKLENYVPKWFYWSRMVSSNVNRKYHDREGFFTFTKADKNISMELRFTANEKVIVIKESFNKSDNSLGIDLAKSTEEDIPDREYIVHSDDIIDTWHSAAIIAYQLFQAGYVMNFHDQIGPLFRKLQSCISCQKNGIEGKCSMCGHKLCKSCFRDHAKEKH